MNPFLITETYTLLGVVEQIKPAANYLVDAFFPQVMPVSYSDWVSVEFTKQHRVLAPYVVKGGRGVNMSRAGSTVRDYKAPLVAPRRVIGLGDIERRMIGEQPVYSTVTPAERAARMQAQDLTELLRMIQNRKSKMAAEILQTGGTTIRGYADDGLTVEVDTIEFDSSVQIGATTSWAQAGATIYDDIKGASERIQEDSGIVPTLMVCGKNVEKYLLGNDEIFKWLSIPNRDNLSLMNFAPRYTSPQARFIGYISALNLEVVSYSETYTDDVDGEVKPFLDPDVAIIGVPGQGRQLYGAITYLDGAGNWNTVAAENVPVYNFNADAQTTSLTIYSRFLLVPQTTDDYICIKVTG